MRFKRDVEIVEWIGRLGAVGVDHVMAHFGISRNSAFRHLTPLVRSGLLTQHRLLFSRPQLYVVTRAGLRWRDLGELGVCQVSAGRFEHTWQIAEVAVTLLAGLPDWRVLSEREILRHERQRRELLASVRVGPGYGDIPAMHRPDLALLSPHGRVAAIEVELWAKTPARLVTICNGWARARHVDAVYYLASPKAARAVGRAVQKTRAEDWIKVLPLEQTHELMRLEREATEGGDEDERRAALSRPTSSPDTLPLR